MKRYAIIIAAAVVIFGTFCYAGAKRTICKNPQLVFKSFTIGDDSTCYIIEDQKYEVEYIYINGAIIKRGN